MKRHQQFAIKNLRNCPYEFCTDSNSNPTGILVYHQEIGPSRCPSVGLFDSHRNMQISQIQAGSVVAEECMVMDNLTKNHLYVPRQKGRLGRVPFTFR